MDATGETSNESEKPSNEDLEAAKKSDELFNDFYSEVIR